MAEREKQITLIAKLTLSWQMTLRWVLGLWVRPRVQADADGNIGVGDDKPVCYVLDSYALSSVLILDKCCENKKRKATYE